MKLLFDQNLSPKLTEMLPDVYPGSGHVSLVGLDRASDEEVWTYARDNGYAIVTKDTDFDELSQTRGFPPKVIWLQLGNCTTVRSKLSCARDGRRSRPCTTTRTPAFLRCSDDPRRQV